MKKEWKQEAARAGQGMRCAQRFHKLKRAALCCAMAAAMWVESAYAAGIGPGVTNLSPQDSYAVYQWGLKNDGRLSVDRAKLKQEAYASLYQSYQQWESSGRIGIPPRTVEPGDFESEVLQSQTGMDIHAAEAFALYEQTKAEKGDSAFRDVVVALIDTGVDTEHEELADALWVNADEIPGNGIDDDGNGYVDDVHGYNFFNNNTEIRDNKQADLHGTHAAGTIAAKRGNGGMTGLVDNAHVKLMILKALDEDGAGTEESVLAAIRYAEANGASICNLSLGGTEQFPKLEEAIAASKMLFVVAAGNGDARGVGYDTDARPVYPASFASDNIISVANLIFAGELERSSNYGAESVDVAAPGTYIFSASPGNRFTFLTGTSMAAPMVTGICAFVYSYRPDLTLFEVRDAVFSTCTKLDSLQGKVKYGGVPNLYAAMQYGR